MATSRPHDPPPPHRRSPSGIARCERARVARREKKPLHARLDRIASGSSGSVGPVDAAKVLDGLAVIPAFVTHTCVDTSERASRAVGHGTSCRGPTSTQAHGGSYPRIRTSQHPARVRPPERRAIVCCSQIPAGHCVGATRGDGYRESESSAISARTVERPRRAEDWRCDRPATKSSAAGEFAFRWHG
jgi:hypothetical protein